MRNIEWSDKANNDLQNILLFWLHNNQSDTFSVHLLGLIEKMVEFLAVFPETGRVSEVPDVRMKHIRDYWIFYNYSSTKITIIQISSTHQNPESFYKDL